MTEKTTPAKTAAAKPSDPKAEEAAKAKPDTSVDGVANGTDTEAPSPVEATVGTDDTPAQPEGTPERLEGVDASVAPYPLYEELDVDALRSLAKDRGVSINADVEKALLIQKLRDRDTEEGPDGRVGPADDATTDNRYASYDLMPLDALRGLAKDRDVELDPKDEKSHLVTELRAADSGA